MTGSLRAKARAAFNSPGGHFVDLLTILLEFLMHAQTITVYQALFPILSVLIFMYLYTYDMQVWDTMKSSEIMFITKYQAHTPSSLAPFSVTQQDNLSTYVLAT